LPRENIFAIKIAGGRILQAPNRKEIQDHWAQDSPWLCEAVGPSIG
jgi:hypothetical protein